ncbi:hypothetical protein SAMN05878494_3940 [Bacillus cereus]|nr:hypothetical protein SAMN05878494_3940 [Bacillus cereus]
MVNYFKQFLLFIWKGIFKSIPIHTVFLWFYPEQFKFYTTVITKVISYNQSFTALVFTLAFIIFTHVKMVKEQKDTGNTDLNNTDLGSVVEHQCFQK